ncbi:MAG: hypothetical protein NT034_00725 [Candidatus Magasanikbacteria bacterium]|nr:hypothetical protein [Candidatus Magasanikbacteria bacterium]
MARDDFNGALGTVLRQEFGVDWKDDESTIEIDSLLVWDLLRRLEIVLGERPVNAPVVRDMSLKDFVTNMMQAFGFA